MIQVKMFVEDLRDLDSQKVKRIESIINEKYKEIEKEGGKAIGEVKPLILNNNAAVVPLFITFEKEVKQLLKVKKQE